jgi:hypothetical protein
MVRSQLTSGNCLPAGREWSPVLVDRAVEAEAIERLPVPQREALGSAFGMTAGPPADRFLVGLAALTLITDLAVDRPVLAVIDDAQWLDRVSVEVLGFVARRLFADWVGMLFAVREGEQRSVVLEGLSELTIGALPEDAAGELLAGTVGRPVDQGTGAQIVAEAAGTRWPWSSSRMS